MLSSMLVLFSDSYYNLKYLFVKILFIDKYKLIIYNLYIKYSGKFIKYAIVNVYSSIVMNCGITVTLKLKFNWGVDTVTEEFSESFFWGVFHIKYSNNY